jgi:hypothetical protein
MKKIGFLTTVFLLTLSAITISFGQKENISTRQYIRKIVKDTKSNVDTLGEKGNSNTIIELYKNKKNTPDDVGTKKIKTISNLLLTNPSINKLFTTKMAYYLSGTDDLSLFGTYFAFNQADGKTDLGFNRTFPNDDENLVNKIVNVGLRTDKLGSIYSNKQFSSDIGVFFNFTFAFKGTVGWYPATKMGKDKVVNPIIEMDEYRDYLDCTFENQLQKDSIEFVSRLCNDSSDYKKDEILTFNKTNRKKYKALFVEKELSHAEELMSSIHKSFITIGGYLPVSGVSDGVKYKDVATNTINTYNPKPYELHLRFSHFVESKKNNYLVTASLGTEYYNPTKIYEKYSGLQVADSTQLNKKLLMTAVPNDNDKFFVGNYSEFFLWKWNGKFLWKPINFLQKSDIINSMSFYTEIERTFGKYAATDLTLGVILGLPSQDEKGINLNISCKWLDVSKDLVSGVNRIGGPTINLGLGIPLSSMIY